MDSLPKTETPRKKRLLPPHLLLAAVLVSLALDRWLPLAQLWHRPWTYVGGAIVVVALVLNVLLAIGFRRRNTTIVPFRESTVLITKGLYCFSRNPIYLTMVVLLCGEAIALGSLSPWVVPPLFATAISWQFIQCEEAMLSDKFGDQYRDYCRRVRRWL